MIQNRGSICFSSLITSLLLAQVLMLASVKLVRGEDNRCFLSGGGSTDSFFVPENLPVGHLVGSLRVIGNADEDIDLSLINGSKTPVALSTAENGSSVLLLTEALDREGKLGPAGVAVSLLCTPRNSTQPGYTIPISIRVTDVNDNAPVFSSSSYKARVSEATPTGSTLLQIRASDADQPGPFSTVEYSVLDGPHSHFVRFPSPLEGRLLLDRPLDFESVAKLEVTLEARDQGNPILRSRASLVVTVLDADDQNPAFLEEHYAAVLPYGALPGDKLYIEPQPLEAVDQDREINSTITYSFHGSSHDEQFFQINDSTGEVVLRQQLDKSWPGSTLVVKAIQTDNPDRYSVVTLAVLRPDPGAGLFAFSKDVYTAHLMENLPMGSTVLTLTTNKEVTNISIADDELPGQQFTVMDNGDLVLVEPLDFENATQFVFSVFAFDELDNNATALVNISVLNVNDSPPKFSQELYRFTVGDGENVVDHHVGRVDVSDGDVADELDLELQGADARAFHIFPSGDLIIAEPARLNRTTEAHLVVVAQDSGIPPRLSSVPVVVRIGQGEATSRQLSSPLPNWFIIWILFLILVVLVVVILSLGVYICRTKSKNLKGPGSSTESVTSEEEEVGNGEREARSTPAHMSGSIRESTGSRASISRGSSCVPSSRAMSAISSIRSERMSASSACLSSTIHLPYKPPPSSFSSLKYQQANNVKLPQSPSSSSTYSTRVLDCRSPVSAYQVSSPHTPTIPSTPNSLLPETKDVSLLQIHSSREEEGSGSHPIYSQAVPRFERGQRSTPARERRRLSSNKVAPLAFQPRSQSEQQLEKQQQFSRNKVTSMASTESAYSSGSGETDEQFGPEEHLGDHVHQQQQQDSRELGDQHRDQQQQEGGRELQQELRARIMASPYAAAWPRASIPRRVHKLSWEEEQLGRHHF